MRAEDRQLLDQLCACASQRVYVKRPRRDRLRRALTRLRYRGLVAFDLTYRPSESAMLDWRERNQIERARGEVTIPLTAVSREPEAAELNRRPYLEADDEVIEVGYEAGTLVQSIADELGRSPNSITARARTLGLKHQGPKTSRAPRLWTDAKQARFLELLLETGSQAKAAAALGLQKGSVTTGKKRFPKFAQRCDEALAELAKRAAAAKEPEQPIEAHPAADARPVERPGCQYEGRDSCAAASGPLAQPFRQKPTEVIVRETLAHLEERERMAAMRPPMGADEAKLTLQRRGFSVCRASTVGGEPGQWAVGTLRLTEAEMIDKAKRAQR